MRKFFQVLLGTIILFAAANNVTAQVLWNQTGNSTGGNFISHYFPSAINADFRSEGADDFVVTGGNWIITSVYVEGVYAAGTVQGMDTCHLRIYSNSGGAPGSLVYNNLFTGVDLGQTGNWTLPVSTTLTPGTYWFSLQTHQQYDGSSLFFWGMESIQSGIGAMWRNPNDGYGFGCTSWASASGCGAGNPDYSFRINGTVSTTPTYCIPTLITGTGDGDWIETVQLGSINNTTGASAAPYYEDYTAQSTNLALSANYNLNITSGQYTPDYYAAWIDYNQDGDFSDTGEKLGEFASSASFGTQAINFTVPANAASGPTVMRVRCIFSQVAGVDPCAGADYGETEDYTVNIGGCSVNVTATSSNASCGNSDGTATASATNGQAPFTYAWDAAAGFQSTATATNLGPGSYSVVVTDNNGCIGSATAVVGNSNGPSVTVSGTNPSCVGANGSVTASASGGVLPYTWNWSNGATTQNISSLPAGTYSVTVSDANSCTATNSTSLTSTGGPSLSFSTTNANCAPTGALTVQVSGGNDPYSYTWSNGQTSSTISGLSVGTYSVTVVDDDGCAAISSAMVQDDGNGPNVSVSVTDVSCNGAVDGAATANVTGGTSPYSYHWSSGGNSSSVSALWPALHNVTVTDANGCETVETILIEEPDPLSGTTTSQNADCGMSNGSATVAGVAGTAPYTYLWPSSAGSGTGTSAGSLAAATYNITITDANGCTYVATAAVTNSGAPLVTLIETNPLCHGNTNGSIQTQVLGGAQPYSYSWSTGSSNNAIGGLGAGTYTLTVSDANGCNAVLAYEMVAPDPLVLTSAWTPTIPPACNGTSTIMVQGGTSPFSYLWNGAAGGQTTQTASGLCLGTYTCQVTDANGCQKLTNAKVDSIIMGVQNIRTVLERVTVYPNPTREYVEVDIEMTKSRKLDVRLQNSVGQIVQRQRATGNNRTTLRFEVSTLPRGIYFMTIVSEDGDTTTRKVLLQ